MLHEVLDPGCNLAIWQGAVSGRFADLLAEDRDDLRFQSAIRFLHDRLRLELEAAGYEEAPATEELIAGVASLAEHFCAVLGLDELEVRLEVVATDSCRKWHADYVRARLIATLVGPGTQWLTSADAERVRSGLEPLRVNAMAPGDAGIFKGKLATGAPAVHRSPPIAGTGAKRLLVVLNPPAES